MLFDSLDRDSRSMTAVFWLIRLMKSYRKSSSTNQETFPKTESNPDTGTKRHLWIL